MTFDDHATRIWGELRERVAFFVARHAPVSEVEDICQDVFVALFKALERGQAIEDPGKYVYGIAKNVVRRRIRDKIRHPTIPLDDAPEPTIPSIAEQGVLDGERERLLNCALQRLSDDDRELIRLTYHERMTSFQVAERFGRSPDWVRQRLTRARRVLRVSLAGLN